jgi:hypothetical protein
VESLTASSSEASTTATTITSAIVKTLDTSGTSTSSSAKQSPSTGTNTKDKGNKTQDSGKASSKPQGPAGGKTAKAGGGSDRPGREFATVGPKKRSRGESQSPHDQPKKFTRGGTGLITTFRKSEGAWQDRAFTAE